MIMTLDRSWWFAAKNVFRIAIALCTLRVAVKIGVGLLIASPLLVGDGVHNIGDTGVLVAAYWVDWFIRNRGENMYGKDNLPAVFQLVIAGLMGFLACLIARSSFLGLLSGETPRTLDASSLLIVGTAIAVSVLISITASAYQIRSRVPTLVAAGTEMRGDALIECSILLGFVGEYFWNAPRVEYFAGLCVVLLIGKTAWKMGIEAWNCLFQVSISEAFEEGVRSLVLSTYGVDEIEKLETYPSLLKGVRIKVWVCTRGGSGTNEDLKFALKKRLCDYALRNGYPNCDPDVFFARSNSRWHRVAYAVVENDGCVIVASDFNRATQLRVCDVEYGEVAMAWDVEMPESIESLVALLIEKHVSIYRSWDEEEGVVKALKSAGINYLSAPTLTPPHE